MDKKLDVKVGDKVVVIGRFGDTSISEVERITPKGAIRVNGTLYNEYGYQKGGDSYYSCYIRKATADDIKDIQIRKYVIETLIKMRECKKLTYNQALEIRKILGEEE